MTPAKWMRQFITEHPLYKKDSRVPPEAAYDLMKACSDIGCGKRECKELHGDIKIAEIVPAVNPFVANAAPPAAVAGLDEKRTKLLEQFRLRAAEKQIAELDRAAMEASAEVER